MFSIASSNVTDSSRMGKETAETPTWKVFDIEEATGRRDGAGGFHYDRAVIDISTCFTLMRWGRKAVWRKEPALPVNVDLCIPDRPSRAGCPRSVSSHVPFPRRVPWNPIWLSSPGPCRTRVVIASLLLYRLDFKTRGQKGEEKKNIVRWTVYLRWLVRSLISV